MIEITNKNSISGSAYTAEYSPVETVPPVLLITDRKGGVPVLENLVAVIKELEQRLNRNIRFFPVLIVAKGTASYVENAYQLLCSDSLAKDFAVVANWVDERVLQGPVHAVAKAWCNIFLADLPPKQIRCMLNPALTALLAEAVQEGVRHYGEYEEHQRREAACMATGTPGGCVSENHLEAFVTIGGILRSVFFASKMECQDALKSVFQERGLSGYGGDALAYVDAYLAALREELGRPVIIRDQSVWDKRWSNVIAVYREGICPPPTADINNKDMENS